MGYPVLVFKAEPLYKIHIFLKAVVVQRHKVGVGFSHIPEKGGGGGIAGKAFLPLGISQHKAVGPAVFRKPEEFTLRKGAFRGGVYGTSE